MNVLFMSLLDFSTFQDRNIYSDLLRELIKRGHKIYCISPVEKNSGKQTQLIIDDNGNTILKLKIGNIQKVNVVEKGISTMLIKHRFVAGIKKYFSNVHFDLVLYTTPPITFAGAIQYVKKRDNAKTYLMLKDIFPQNSVDLGMLSKHGLKGLIYRYFRKKERKLYSISDRIGCMSAANCRYLLEHNPEIIKDKVEVFPNCIEPVDYRVTAEEKTALRRKYGLPEDKLIFVYGGNLGRPQNVPFIVECLKAALNIENAYFVIAGSGTDRAFLEEFVNETKPANIKLYGQFPKEEYDRIVSCCDVGLIFLDYRFSIPNFPSRLLSYMQAGLPTLACTDENTDIGDTIVSGSFGWKCVSDDVSSFVNCIESIVNTDLKLYSDNAWQYLLKHYSTTVCCDIIDS